MTERQFKLLALITTFISERGFSPSYDEMKRALGLKSKSNIHALIVRLEERGHVRRTRGARSVELVRVAS